MPVTVSITDSVIRMLTTNPSIVEQFPFIRFAKANLEVKEKRSCCGKAKRSGQGHGQVYETVRASIAHLGPDRIAILKKALNANALVIPVTVNGKVTVYNK